VNISKKISIIEIDSLHKYGRGAYLYMIQFFEEANAVLTIPANQ
jgi:hypothetical protein